MNSENKANPGEVLGYLNGPWSNAACMGYVIMAMQRAGLDERTIKKVVDELPRCFDDTAVEEAAWAWHSY